MLAASMNQQGRSPYIIVINCGEREARRFVMVGRCGFMRMNEEFGISV